MAITTFSEKGNSLTYSEMDGNFDHLDIKTQDGWRDNIVSINPRLGAPNSPELNLFKDGIYHYSFFAGQLTEAWANFHVDHDYKLGSPIYPHVHWSINTASLGTVRWGFEYQIAKGHQQMAFTDSVIVYVEQESLGIPYMHYVAEVSDQDVIPGTLIEPDTIISIRLFRDGANVNDTMNDDVFGITIDLHYQADRSTTKNKSPNFYI